MPAAENVLIVGAGIVGQTMAIALSQRGVNCHIVELKENFEIAGAGMIVQGTALRAYMDIGLVEDIADAGWYDPTKNMVYLDTLGEIVFESTRRYLLGKHYPDRVVIRRQALHEVLNRHMERSGASVGMGVTVASLVDSGNEVAVEFSDGTSGIYDLVFGCDGISSKVRELVFPGIEPQFAGFCNWRMIVPWLASIPGPRWMWGHGKSVGILPVNENELYIAGVGKAATAQRPPQNTVLETFRRKFACFKGPMTEILKMDIDPNAILYTVMEQVKLPPPWFKGRVVVMGDAAHASCPFWAQGASMGIEDAIAFAQELDRADALDHAVTAWFERRYERAKYVQDGSFATGRHLNQDDESDEPKFFAPANRDALAKASAERGRRLAEAF